MIHTCNVKDPKEVEKIGRREMYFTSLAKIRDGKPTIYGLQHQKWRNTYHQIPEKGRGIIVWTWEKRKQKIKKLSKITRVDEQELLVQSAGSARAVKVWSRWYIFVFTKTWKLSIYISEYWCHVVDNPSEEVISEISQIKE